MSDKEQSPYDKLFSKLEQSEHMVIAQAINKESDYHKKSIVESYERLLKIGSLINSAGAISVLTFMSVATATIWLITSLVFFILSLSFVFILLFIEFKYIKRVATGFHDSLNHYYGNELTYNQLLHESYSCYDEKTLWFFGIIAITTMTLGVIFGLSGFFMNSSASALVSNQPDKHYIYVVPSNCVELPSPLYWYPKKQDRLSGEYSETTP